MMTGGNPWSKDKVNVSMAISRILTRRNHWTWMMEYWQWITHHIPTLPAWDGELSLDGD